MGTRLSNYSPVSPVLASLFTSQFVLVLLSHLTSTSIQTVTSQSSVLFVSYEPKEVPSGTSLSRTSKVGASALRVAHTRTICLTFSDENATKYNLYVNGVKFINGVRVSHHI